MKFHSWFISCLNTIFAGTNPFDRTFMKIKAAVIQENPVFFDKEKTIRKVGALAQACAADGCKLVLFPESFIPAYPRGFTFGTKIGYRTDQGRSLYTDYYNAAIDLESDDLPRLEELAKSLDMYLVIGVTEKQQKNGSLYCSMLYLSPEKGLLGVHRKIKPTGTERIVWAEAAGDSLVTFDTKIGRLGGLICWENYMPFARMSMFRQGVELYLAPTADARDEWTATMKHIALEGRCFVLGCNQYFTRAMVPAPYADLVVDEPEILSRGGSVIISPQGKLLAGPLFDEAGILTAELDLEEVTKAKLDFDVVGHYSRDDIFEFNVKGQPDIIRE